MMTTSDDLKKLCDSISYYFKNRELLVVALTHPSCYDSGSLRGYERLEFLGDAILGAVVAELLFVEFQSDSDGALSRKKMALVCGNYLAGIAMEIGLGEYIRFGRGEALCDGKSKIANLENTMEALIGAVYIDGGFVAAKALIMKYWMRGVKSMKIPPRDSKSLLQELSHAMGFVEPVYTVKSVIGDAHNPIFNVEVQVRGYGVANAVGNTKKSAEQEAAKVLIERIKKDNE